MTAPERRAFDPRAALRRGLRSLPEYAALEDTDTIARALGIEPRDVIKVDGNENPYGPSPRALDALARVGYAPHLYGDAAQQALRAALARHLGVPAASIVAGSGSDELIELLFRLYIEEGDRVVTASPTFGMYAFNAQIAAAKVADVPLLANWQYDTEGLVDAALEAKAVFIPRPNNPTGNVLPDTLVERLLETGALVVIDEAYIEFSHAESLVRPAAETPGLVVLRTFSKWGGLAGLRVGYGVMHPETAAVLMQTKDPYNVNAAAEAAAIASLEDADVLDDRACTLAGERDRIAEALGGLGWVHPYPSEAVFFLMRLEGITGRDLRDRLRQRGIFTRYFESPRLRDHLRISVGLPEQNDRIIEAFREIGKEVGRG